MAKNSLLRAHGHSPYQIALARNPEVPTDLMQETPNSAALHDEPFAEMEKRRPCARQAVLEYMDNRAARVESFL
eukprot:3614689-Pyramimonas_sp.AAC.1